MDSDGVRSLQAGQRAMKVSCVAFVLPISVRASRILSIDSFPMCLSVACCYEQYYVTCFWGFILFGEVCYTYSDQESPSRRGCS